MRPLIPLPCITAALLICNIAAAKTPVVAVFNVEDKTRKLAPEERDQLTAYLSAQIAQGGRFKVLPGGRIKDRLRQQKKASYRDCYDQKCQVEIGRELAASKSLSTQIVKIGSRCAVLVTLFDLRAATTELSASAKGSCDADGLVGALEKAIGEIKGQGSSSAPTAISAGGELVVDSRPPGAAVLLDSKQLAGVTPMSIPGVRAGHHRLELRKDGYLVGRKAITTTGRRQTISFTLAEAPKRLAPAATSIERPPRAIAALADAPGRAAAPTAGSAPRGDRSGTPTWGWISLGVGVASLATAGVMYGLGLAQGNDAHQRYEDTTDPAEMETHWAAVESAEKKLLAGHVLVGVGAAAVGLWVYSLLSRRSTGPGKKVARWSVGCTATYATVTGRF